MKFGYAVIVFLNLGSAAVAAEAGIGRDNDNPVSDPPEPVTESVAACALCDAWSELKAWFVLERE